MASELAQTPVILLAGGKSSRMGQPKGLVAVNGRPWLEVQLTLLAACGLREAAVVLGYDSQLYFDRLPWLLDARAHSGAEKCGLRVRSVVNPLPEFGPFSSIQAGGTLALNGSAYVAFWILPIDVPCAKSAVWERLSQSSAPVAVPLFEGRGGHPVRVTRTFLNALLALPPNGEDSRLDRQIRNTAGVERIEVGDPGILKNFNTPEDWDKSWEHP